MYHNVQQEEGRAGEVLTTARRSLFGPLLAAFLGAIAAVEAARGMAAMLSTPWAETAALVVVGGGAAIALALVLSRAIASLTAQPVVMLLEQLDPGDVAAFQMTRGRPMRRAALAADLKLMHRRVREVIRRSRLTIGELESAREKAQRQNLAKSQFLTNMSHELRTPLNAILGYAMLLHEDATGAGDHATVEDLNRIQQAGRDLLALINDILDLSKMEAGRATADRIPIDVPSLVGEAIAHWGKVPNGNALSVAVDDGARAMIGDPVKTRQCINNLLSNAFKFTRDGSVSLHVSTDQHDGTDMIVFQVSDTGLGIAPDQIDRLFEPFHQAEAGASRHFGGAGLGLTIVARLAQLMGGTCTVDSHFGEGSTFRLSLPINDPGAAQIASADAPLTRVVQAAGPAKTALVVDDDQDAINLMQRWLTRLGYSVVCTNDAQSTAQLAREHRADLILLDALLPGRSGYDLLGDLGCDPQLAAIPTILITVDDDRVRGLKAGAADYLRKPVTEAQLRDVLEVYRTPSTGDILVIDDEDDSADLLSRSIRHVGFTTRRAVDGRQGLDMALAARPDAIILDLSMPNMDGFEVIQHLAASVELSAVPLMIVSGFDISIEHHRRLVEAGHRYFPKAASTPREIAQSLKELVG